MVRQLRLFLDNKKIIRCGGRIHNAPLDRNTKFPALPPKEYPLTKLIVYAVHKEQLHAGVNGTVNCSIMTRILGPFSQAVGQVIAQTMCNLL